MATEKHPGGRPEGDYTEHIELGEKYMAKYHEVLGEAIPTVVGFAHYCRTSGLPISRETIYARSEFSDIIGRIQELQELKLNNALVGDYHPRFAQFLLAAKHGYVEKSSKELTGNAHPRSAAHRRIVVAPAAPPRAGATSRETSTTALLISSGTSLTDRCVPRSARTQGHLIPASTSDIRRHV